MLPSEAWCEPGSLLPGVWLAVPGRGLSGEAEESLSAGVLSGGQNLWVVRRGA